MLQAFCFLEFFKPNHHRIRKSLLNFTQNFTFDLFALRISSLNMSDIDFRYPVSTGPLHGECFMMLYRPGDPRAVHIADLRNYGETTVTVQGVDITFSVTRDCHAKDKKGDFPEGLYLKVGKKVGMQFQTVLR